MKSVETFCAFDGTERFVDGTLPEVADAVLSRLASTPESQVLVFSLSTGKQTDVIVCKCVGTEAPHVPSPGRPKLGVVGREVTLLPRHWEWLNSQSGGASVALRKLVEMAMRENVEKDQLRQRHEAAYRFMTALGGDLPGYEEALRCLFANDRDGLEKRTKKWPADVQEFALYLAFASN